MLRSALIGLAAALWATTALAQPTNATRELQATFGRVGGEELRYALVIGNSAYPDAPLNNPANDARLMSETLNDVGFAVTEVVDADWRAMKRAIQEFGRQFNLAGDNAVGLFYYAGHGIQVGGQNYLVPVGAPIATEADVEIEAVNAQSVLAQMEYARNRLNIVILDACRNNPYRRSFRSAPNGLAQMQAPSGSLVTFATAPGDVAADGTGENSPYAEALAEAMAEPGLEVLDLFREVRIAVGRSEPRQVPWFQSSLDGEFFFARATDEAAPAAPEPAPEPAGPVYDRAADFAFWNSIVDGNDPRLFEAYLKQFPEGVFADIARLRIEALTQEAAAAAVVEEDPVAVAPPAAAVVPADPVPDELGPAPLGPDERRTVQQALNGLGYDAGSVDGVFGAATEAAVARWQAAAGFEPTGSLTAPQLAALIGAWRAAGSPRQPDEPETAAIVAEPAAETPPTALAVEGQEVYELGLSLAALTPETRADLGVDATTEGLLITDVRASGRSANTKLAAGDVIERVNRRPMTKPVEVVNEITVRLREGQTTFRLDVRKPDDALWTVLVAVN